MKENQTKSQKKHSNRALSRKHPQVPKREAINLRTKMWPSVL